MLFSFFFLGVLPAACLPAAEETSSVLQEAEALCAAQQYVQCLTLYERALSLDRSPLQAYRGMVECYRALGDPQGAVVYMEALFLEQPEKAEVCYGLGYALYAARNYDEARRFFEKAVELNEHLAEAWNNIAVIYHFRMRDYERARTYYQQAIAVSTKTGNAWVAEIAQKNLEHLPSTEELQLATQEMSLEAFINTFIARAEARDERGLAVLVSGRTELCAKAAEWFLGEAMRAGAAGNKDDEQTALLLVQTLAHHCREAPGSAELQDMIGRYAHMTDETKKQIVQGEQLLQGGLVHEHNGRHAEAEQAYLQAGACFERISDRRRAGTALVHLGDLYRTLHRYNQAHEAYSRAMTCFIETRQQDLQALTLSCLGITDSLRDNHGDALAFFRRSWKLYRQLNDEESAGKVKCNIELVEAAMNRKAHGQGRERPEDRHAGTPAQP